MNPKLNLLAVQNADVLRLIEDSPNGLIPSVADLARQLGRDGSNMAKTVKALIAAGLLTEEALTDGLTDEGRAQLAMIGRAEHGGDKRRIRGHWPLDKIRPNPANRPIDPAAIPGLADSIEAAGEVLQPALLTPPDASGVRMLLAGERRWSALCLLQQRGTEDPDLWGRGLPFIEKEADQATALLITLIENGQRQDLSPWEDAQQLLALQTATGWSAREIAKKTGRSPADSDTGVRDVQQKIKVAREATPEAIAEYDRTGSWDQLRDSVTKPRTVDPADRPDPVTELSRLIAEHNPPPSGEGDREAVEGAHAAPPAAEEAADRIAELVDTYTLRNPKQPQRTPLLRIDIGQHADGSWTFATGYSTDTGGSSYGLSFVEARKRSMNDRLHARAVAVAELRETALNGTDRQRRIRWLDDVRAGAIEPDGATAAAPDPARPASGGARGSQPVPASETASRALAELARWERDAPMIERKDGCVRIDRTTAWSSPEFRQLKEAALIRVVDDALYAYAAVRPSGREWLATKGTGYVAAVHNSQVWKTPWIAKIADAKAEQPAAQPEPETPSPGADRPADVRKQAAEAMRNLHQRWNYYDMAAGETDREEFAQAADAVATPLPWRIDAQGGIVAANGQPIIHGRGDNHPDAPAVTRMRIIVLAVNAMAAMLTPADDTAGEGDQ